MQKFDSTTYPTLALLTQTASVMKQGVFWLNQDGHILAINRAYAVQLGYPEEGPFDPKTVFEVNPSMSLLSWKRLWKKLIAEERISLDTEHITADESIYPVHMRMLLMEVDNITVCMALVENLMETNRYKDLLEMTAEVAGVGAFEFDLVHNEIIITDEFYRLMGIPVKKKISVEEAKVLFRRNIANEDLPKYIENNERAVQEGRPFEQELAYQIDGEYKTFNMKAIPVQLEEQTIKIYGTIQNVEKISKRTDEMYFTKFCLDHARSMIFWIEEADQKIAYANITACKTLGYKQGELVGQHYSILIREDEKTVSWEDIDKRLVVEEQVDLELTFKTKAGDPIPVSTSTDRLEFRGKKINCTFARNLSKKKRRDTLLKLAQYSLDQSIDMIFWLNADATFQYFNDAFVNRTGYTHEEIKQMTILDFFIDSDMENFKKGWTLLQNGHSLQSADRIMRLKNGQQIPVEITVNMVKVENNEYSTTILRDITERKQKEADLENYLSEIKRLKENAEAENILLKEEINLEHNFNNIITQDPNYKTVMRQVEQVADTDATVLLLGETGTGKELLARAVHMLSARADYPMIKVNCGALPENLIESELFGHEKGAFTGAHQQKIGKFERADKGTIFLDEIGELPLDLQTQLLRILQEGEIERVGGSKLLKLDVRVIAATNRNLEEQVAAGKFREDLYYRLNVFPIYNIPLRERKEDIPILVKHFVEKYGNKLNKQISEISPSSLNKLMSYSFPGNVRELENIIERSIILSKGKVLSIDSSLIQEKKSTSANQKFNTMEEMQKEHIINALRRTKGKVSGTDGAAALLDMNDKTLTSRMRKLGIEKRDYLKNEK